MRNPFDNTPPQPPRSIVSLPIQLLYALFSSYPLFATSLSLSLSRIRSLSPSAFRSPSPLLLLCRIRLALLVVLYPPRSLSLPISSRRSCAICPAPVLFALKKGRHGFAAQGSLSFISVVHRLHRTDRGVGIGEREASARKSRRTDE